MTEKIEMTAAESEIYLGLVRRGNMDDMFNFGALIGAKSAFTEVLEKRIKIRPVSLLAALVCGTVALTIYKWQGFTILVLLNIILAAGNSLLVFYRTK